MDSVLLLFSILIPVAALIVVIYLFLKKFNEDKIKTLQLQLKQERTKFFLEPRLDAYQRIVLLLERITPANLIMRIHNPSKSANEMHSEILSTIRREFDHNVAQQIFISPAAWEMVKKSKEETIKLINIAAKQMEEEATATDLSNKVFELNAEIGELPTEIAIKYVKEELQKLF